MKKQQIAKYAKKLWVFFDEFSDRDLDDLIESAGWAVPKDRARKTELALYILWFNGHKYVR